MEIIDFIKLGDECKKLEEACTWVKFKPPGVLMARLDGRAFHNFTRNCEKPADGYLMTAMQSTMIHLVKEFACSFGYTQSDEITLGWDLTSPSKGQEFPFSGRVSKINSVLAASASLEFNSHEIPKRIHRRALFDCRSWLVPDQETAMYNVLWRQLDCERNAINATASSLFPESELNGVNTEERLKKIEGLGVKTALSRNDFKYGTLLSVDKRLAPILEHSRMKAPEKHRLPKEQLVVRTGYNYIQAVLKNLTKEEAIKNLFKAKL